MAAKVNDVIRRPVTRQFDLKVFRFSPQLLLMLLFGWQYATAITQKVQNIAEMSVITIDERASACAEVMVRNFR